MDEYIGDENLIILIVKLLVKSISSITWFINTWWAFWKYKFIIKLGWYLIKKINLIIERYW
jgi:hypothetical protein